MKSTVKKENKVNLSLLNNKFLELAIYVPLSLKRNKPMNAIFFINKMRQILIQIHNYSHKVEREFDFESNADVHLISDLRTTYGNCTNNDVKKHSVPF